MEEQMKEQIEAADVAAEYCVKLEAAICNAVKELEGVKYEDTDEYVKKIIEGINWTIQVYNATKKYLHEVGIDIDEAAVNDTVNNLNAAVKAGDDAAIAQCLKTGMLDFVKLMQKAAPAAGVL